MAIATQGTARNYLQRAPSPSGLADVVELIHDKGLVIDANVRSAGIGLGTAGGRPLGERPVGEHLVTRAKLIHRRACVVGGERPVVALVDRGHGRDVARPHALEATQVHLAVLRARADVVGLLQAVNEGNFAESGKGGFPSHFWQRYELAVG